MIAIALSLVLQDDEGFTPLFNGRDLAGWTFVSEPPNADPARTFRVEDGVLVCNGSPSGYLRTDASYSHFTLRFEWRYRRPDGLAQDADFAGNSGYLLFIAAPNAMGVWPRCVEVQGMNRDAGAILPLPRSLRCRFEDDPEARRRALRPVGEWNRMEITAHEGAVEVRLNDVHVATVTECELTDGPIGFQSEGAEIHWRNIRIREEK